MEKRLRIAAFACLFLAPLSLLPEEKETAASLAGEAIKAYKGKDFPRFLALERRVLALEPENPRAIYNVACGEALLGHAPAAVALLEGLLERKLDLGAQGDDDFSSIRKSPEWARFESKLKEIRTPLVRSKVAFTLPDPALLSTGIAVDSKTGDTFVASVRERKIVRRTKDGVVSDFITKAQDGFLAGASLEIDEGRGLLVASTSAVPFMEGYSPGLKGQSGVFVFDVHSGKLVRKGMLRAAGDRHFLNALALARDGSIFVADSGSSGVYRLPPKEGELEAVVPADALRAAQGLALTEDEKTLFVADFADGLFAVDLASGKHWPIEAPKGTWLGGLDGLSWEKGELISVQIGVRPERVLRLRMDREGRRVDAVETLEMSHPDYEGPIQGTVSGGAFLYVANSQLALGNADTGAFAAARARPTVVLRLPLGP
jgi:sugar lactone lactonase YvrE